MKRFLQGLGGRGVDPSLVKDRETLEAYLLALPKDQQQVAAKRIAFRSAMRVFPFVINGVLDEISPHSKTAAFQVMFITAAIAAYAGEHAERISRKAISFPFDQCFAIDAVEYRAFETGFTNFGLAATVVRSTTQFIICSNFNQRDFRECAVFVADAAACAADVFSPFDYWREVRSDLRMDPKDLRMWSEGEPGSFRDAWGLSIGKMRDHRLDWSFWRLWYEQLRKGRDWRPDAVIEVLNGIGKEEWKGDTALLNPLFAEVLALYRAEDERAVIDATPIAEDVSFDPKQQLFVLQPMDRIEVDDLGVILEQIAAARRIFAGQDGLSNAYQPLEDELKLLEDAETRYAKRPIHIMKTVTRVLRRLDHKAGTGDCPTPEQDTKLLDFRDSLQDVQLELAALNDEVRKWYEKTRPRMTAEAVPLIVEGTEALYDYGDPDLRGAVEQIWTPLKDTAADPELVQQAGEHGAGLLARSHRAAKPHFDDTGSIIARDGEAAEEAVATNPALSWLASPRFREFVAAFLKGVS